MQTNRTQSFMERSVEIITGKINEIQFEDFDGLANVLKEFTQFIANHYDLFDPVILKNIAVIELNLRSCREAMDHTDRKICWDSVTSELTNAIALTKKESIL